jgi:hypothetical protein
METFTVSYLGSLVLIYTRNEKDSKDPKSIIRDEMYKNIARLETPYSFYNICT